MSMMTKSFTTNGLRLQLVICREICVWNYGIGTKWKILINDLKVSLEWNHAQMTPESKPWMKSWPFTSWDLKAWQNYNRRIVIVYKGDFIFNVWFCGTDQQVKATWFCSLQPFDVLKLTNTLKTMRPNLHIKVFKAAVLRTGFHSNQILQSQFDCQVHI